MKRRTRIYYTSGQKVIIWDRYKQGDSLHDIARMFDRYHSSIMPTTPFYKEEVITEHIQAGITLADSVNFLVEKYELVRIVPKRIYMARASPPHP
ncbi:TA system toxin CbtA family protein, partial [Raoultella terrigena]|uniref:TA system toxin CbtA family protein n=1 Tax=Raoultella terrigena TaxID=577 RepID=UPI001F20E374